MSFEKDKYIVVKNLLSFSRAKFLSSYLYNKREATTFLKRAGIINPLDSREGYYGDAQIPNTFSIYGDCVFDTLMQELREEFQKHTGYLLSENYTYARLYKNGDELKKHKDRFSCEISSTIFLGGDQWPIYVNPNSEEGSYAPNNHYVPSESKGKKIELEPGDGLIYKGCEIEHWRKPFKGLASAQVFLHYNNVNSEGAEENRFDGRPLLGIPKKGA